MSNIKIGKKEYWYRNFRMSKSTDQKLKKAKKKIGKNWDGVFLTLLDSFNKK